MRQGIILTGISIAALLVALSAFKPGILVQKDLPKNIYADRNVVDCGPVDRNPIDLYSNRRFIPLPGWGNHSFKVSTDIDSAQFYFDQGLSLFYSFHLGESQSSFLEAQRQDSNCAMAYWGYAMASGPIINNTSYSSTDSKIRSNLEKALTLTNDPLEQDLIKSQLTRYVAGSSKTRRELFIDYREAMKQLYEKYSENLEVATLYADAAMLVDARNWYDINGKPYAGTDDIVDVLEKIIEKKPDHPAALHYYIHLVEPSTKPGRATEEADKLLYLMPSVTHMVHMPSHIYIRTGDYQKGILSNKLAVKGYDLYRNTIQNNWEGSRHLYLYHNVDMQGSNALLMGNYNEALEAFNTNLKRFKKSDTADYDNGGFGHYVQFLTVQPYLLNVQFKKWKEILKVKKPMSQHIAHNFYWHFGQGMALAKTNRIAAAKSSLAAMKALMKDPALEGRVGLRSRTIDIMQVPMGILEGAIAMAENKSAAAIEHFQAAVRAEDTLHYAEPESWRLPARHFLGNAFLDLKQYTNAIATFDEDLIDHPLNFWAITGIANAYSKQGMKFPAAKYPKEYVDVLSRSGIKVKLPAR